MIFDLSKNENQEYSKDVELVLNHLGISEPKFLGKGVQSTVFEFENNKVVKILSNSQQQQLEKLKKFYELLESFKFKFQIPKIYEVGKVDEVFYIIEEKINGVEASQIIPQLKGENRKEALRNYFEAIEEFRKVLLAESYGELLNYNREPIKSAQWKDFLMQRVRLGIKLGQDNLTVDVKDISKIVQDYYLRINRFDLQVEKTLVHGDYYFSNVFMNEDLKITGLIDFSELTLIGDFRMDVAGAVCFAKIFNFITEEDSNFLVSLAKEKYGSEIENSIDFYQTYYSLIFSNCKSFDEKTYNWCIANLNIYK